LIAPLVIAIIDFAGLSDSVISNQFVPLFAQSTVFGNLHPVDLWGQAWIQKWTVGKVRSGF
jgi:hypothetical protein